MVIAHPDFDNRLIIGQAALRDSFSGSVMNLPSEVLCLIFGSLEKPALFNVRLVSKLFEEAASPFLFDQVYVSTSRTDLEIANLTVSRFGRYIRTLVFSPTYLKYTLDDFRDVIQWVFNFAVTHPSKCFNQHLEHSCNIYSEQRNEWREVEGSGELIGHLSFILTKMPRIQTVRITACPIFRAMSRELLKSSESDFACSEPGCNFHKIYFDVGPDYGCLTNGRRAWHSLLLALSITKSCVRNLTSDRSCRRWPICCSAFDKSQAGAIHFGASFRGLIKLRLTLSLYDHETQSSTSDADYQESLAKIFASAINLEHLELTFFEEDEEWPRIERILGDCRFPKLKSLELSHINSTEDGLVNLLESSPSLENLELRYHYLRLGSWEHVTSWIKEFLLLSSVSLDVMGGEIPQLFDANESSFLMSDRIVNNFFLQDGENPFTKEALERRKEERNRP